MLEKANLLEAIAGKNRGLLASESDNTAILVAIAQLEAHNPTDCPTAASDLLAGNWRLLYTTSQGLLDIDRFPLLKLGAIYQCIRPETGKLYNIAETYGVPYLEGLISVAARFEPLSEVRVRVRFERWILGVQTLIGYQSPDSFLEKIEAGEQLPAISVGIEDRDRLNWLDITYLDEDLRIGRGNQGSVYVLSKS